LDLLTSSDCWCLGSCLSASAQTNTYYTSSSRTAKIICPPPHYYHKHYHYKHHDHHHQQHYVLSKRTNVLKNSSLRFKVFMSVKQRVMFLWCDAVQSGWSIPTFQRIVLCPSSGQIGLIYIGESCSRILRKVVNLYQSTRRHISDDRNLHIFTIRLNLKPWGLCQRSKYMPAIAFKLTVLMKQEEWL
jgi:hypothetical protein